VTIELFSLSYHIVCRIYTRSFIGQDLAKSVCDDLHGVHRCALTQSNSEFAINFIELRSKLRELVESVRKIIKEISAILTLF